MAADSGIGGIVKIGAIGLGAYLIYEYFFATPAAAPAAATPVSALTIVPATVTAPLAAPAPAGAAAPAPPAAPAFNSLDSIYGRLSAAVGSQALTPDGFNYSLNQQLPAGVSAPDPLAVFPAAGFDRTQTMSLANYWGAVAPYLSAHMGLSGLGVLGGLYDHMRRRGGLYGRAR